MDRSASIMTVAIPLQSKKSAPAISLIYAKAPACRSVTSTMVFSGYFPSSPGGGVDRTNGLATVRNGGNRFPLEIAPVVEFLYATAFDVSYVNES